jgi:regulator of replication initiation timing
MRFTKKISFLIIITIAFYSNSIQGQDFSFRSSDDFVKVYKNQIIKIDADTAYIVSSSRAMFINERLAQLDTLRKVYNSLVDNRNSLLVELNKTQETLATIATLLEGNGGVISEDLEAIISSLDVTLKKLKTNNRILKSNNASLEKEVDDLHKLVKELKKETRGLWIDGLYDKLIVFAGGIGVGVLLALLL